MHSHCTYNENVSTVSEKLIITPAASGSPSDKPLWHVLPFFESSNLASDRGEDFNDPGADWSDNWEATDPAIAGSASQLDSLKPSLEPFTTSQAQSCSGIDPLMFDTGPDVAIPEHHTHFTVFKYVDQIKNGEKVTQYLLESNRGNLFHGTTSTREWTELKAIGGNGSEFSSLPRQLIPTDQLFPPCSPSFQKFSGDPEDEAVYMKSQAILTQRRLKSKYHCLATTQEVLRCELISKTPHPNLAKYLGVETRMIGDKESVVRIAYQRYSMDLDEFASIKRFIKKHHVDFLVAGIKEGMRHLHQLGVVHCDLRPMNVFVTIGDECDEQGHVVLKEVVIGDFDASVEVGEKVSLKRASDKWWPKEMKWGDRAAEWIDEWCLKEIEKWLKEKADIWPWTVKKTAAKLPGSDNDPTSNVIAAWSDHSW